ncbi:MAG: hypothetical protein LBT02_01620, partial [Rickettsiales bacterium]|jgi:hypothetical protein|nr:hypothetical protein [Rickettsiales bacterium]
MTQKEKAKKIFENITGAYRKVIASEEGKCFFLKRNQAFDMRLTQTCDIGNAKRGGLFRS